MMKFEIGFKRKEKHIKLAFNDQYGYELQEFIVTIEAKQK